MAQSPSFNGRPLRAVFFDLDGTLADTAADLSEPINAMRRERGLAALPLAELRPFASMGARGLLGQGLGVTPEAPEFARLRDEFLARYEAALVVHTKLFDGIAPVLDALDADGVLWGVVSNKVERYVRPIVEQLGLSTRSRVAIGGDTTGFAKPHPEPLLHAARLSNVPTTDCVYVGDDARDVVAGRAAGMRTVAAAYGYVGAHDPPAAWGADAMIQAPIELLHLLGLRAAH